jgi:23S rRNA (cytosine1962-C5)-methyltransferase/23S rRNA (guanine2445-N2)-methyltransferase / 23S rRNA (guanine2069-N7)-methyltransferase
MLRKLGSANLEVQCKVLNLFCYTGSISVAAAQSGAHVTSVDLSSTYLKWAEQNFSLNNLPLASHPFVCASAWDYLENHENSSAKFDVIVVDPPTFSNSKKTQTSFDVQRDHRRLLEAAMELLADHGVLWFSTNFSKFELDKVLAKKFHCQEWTAKTVPADFSRGKAHRSFRFNR